jgi:hypothetical protein
MTAKELRLLEALYPEDTNTLALVAEVRRLQKVISDGRYSGNPADWIPNLALERDEARKVARELTQALRDEWKGRCSPWADIEEWERAHSWLKELHGAG